MTNSNFRSSNMQELFGNPTISAPPPPGQIDWQSVVITGTIVIVGAIVTISILRQIQKSQMQNIIVHTQNLHDESISTITDELADQRVMIFNLTNLLTYNKNDAADKEASK